MSLVQQLLPLFQDFKKQCKENPNQAVETLNKLKVKKIHILIFKTSFSNFKTFLPSQDLTNLSDEEKAEIILVRETLELAILLCAQIKDLKSFERHVAQVKSYYQYNFNGVTKSERELFILGLNLLCLLAKNKLAAFHTELELIPINYHSNMYIKHAIDLELYLMEGSYNKLRIAREKVPGEEYLVFMDILMETIREEIADSSEKVYQTIRVSEAQKLLFLKNEEETVKFIQKRKWKVENGEIKFDKQIQVTQSFEETSKQLITKTLLYAKEMERII